MSARKTHWQPFLGAVIVKCKNFLAFGRKRPARILYGLVPIAAVSCSYCRHARLHLNKELAA